MFRNPALPVSLVCYMFRPCMSIQGQDTQEIIVMYNAVVNTVCLVGHFVRNIKLYTGSERIRNEKNSKKITPS
jgi:hypothetical protein